jgi:diguanylate cyclase (GGDEF)-like protein/PAS domain S-box-containing protein
MEYTRLAGHGRPKVTGAPARCALSPGPDAPAKAREFVGDYLTGTPDEMCARARQVVTELVTNSVKHAGGSPVVVQAWRDREGGFDVNVSDGGPGFDAQPRAAGHADPAGWGLMFVDMLADVWRSGGPGAPWVWAHFEPRSIDEDETFPDALLDARTRDLLDVRMLLDSVKDHAIFALDLGGRVTLWNAGAQRLTGYGADDVLGQSLAIFNPDADPQAELTTALSHGRNEIEGWMTRKDGSRFWADSVLTPIFDAAGVLRGFSCVARDVTWRKHLDEDRDGLIQRIKHLARTDDLTGLANRRRWHEELDRELARARRHSSTVCVAMVDMDGFKTYNDEHGHLAGDELLKETAGAWSDALRATDMLARYGGDEFSVTLPDCPIEEALTVIERLRAATPGGLTCSAGVVSTGGAEPAESVIRRADIALYDAKRSGRNATVAP